MSARTSASRGIDGSAPAGGGEGAGGVAMTRRVQQRVAGGQTRGERAAERVPRADGVDAVDGVRGEHLAPVRSRDECATVAERDHHARRSRDLRSRGRPTPSMCSRSRPGRRTVDEEGGL